MRSTFTLVAVVASAGCASPYDPAASSREMETPGRALDDGGAGPASPPVSLACAARDQQGLLEPGEYERTIVTPDERTRTYHVHVPRSAAHDRPLPVVLAFHGGAHTADGFDAFAHLREKSEAAGFVLVLPEGVGAIGPWADGYSQTWNAGSCCAESVAEKVDDVRFVERMLDAIEDEICIDKKRVFSTGFSNGGMISYRLACELSDRIAAIAPVAGGLGDDDRSVTPTRKHFECKPTRPVPVLHTHGTHDACYPIEGGKSPLARLPGIPEVVTGGFEPLAETIETFLQLGDCSSRAPRITYEKGRVECIAYDCPSPAHVELCTVSGGGHHWFGGDAWPGARALCGLEQGVLTDDIVVNDAIWQFFEAHPMP